MEHGKVRTNQHQGLWGLQANYTMSHGKNKKVKGEKSEHDYVYKGRVLGRETRNEAGERVNGLKWE